LEELVAEDIGEEGLGEEGRAEAGFVETEGGRVARPQFFAILLAKPVLTG
jgi:hypothetical protein